MSRPCCCARRDCPAFHHLEQTAEKLKHLEDKNIIAGEYGQALLARHENYVAEAEKDRHRMMEKINSLEDQNQELDGSNKRFIQENRDLLHQLEALNGAVKDSEAKVHSLTEVLNSTQYELERMNGLTSRTNLLHAQLAQLEDDLATANSAVTTTLEENRTATLRWQEAEKTITSLQTEMERIETEARLEKDRHADVLARVERRQTVETELLRNRPWKTGSPGNGVVSHFVKDILQDNANLQLGIMELREMLQRSNDEVEKLRDQVSLSPSLSEGPPDRGGASTPSLGSELGAPNRELHVHHHYHAPARVAQEARKSRAQFQRRKGKQRGSASHTPRTSISLGPAESSASAILSNTSVTIPNRNSKRWSMQSAITGVTNSSSLPSSPYTESIFDRAFADTATDISRPSSPESLMLSPRNGNAFGIIESTKRDSTSSAITSSGVEVFKRSISDGGPRMQAIQMKSPPLEPQQDYDVLHPTHSIIFEENEDLESSQHFRSSPAKQSFQANTHQSPIRPKIRRSASHESLISIHGMDIHTLHTRPSQLLLGNYVASATTSSTQTGITDTSVVATRSTPRSKLENRTTSQSYLSGIAAAHNRQPVRKPSRTLLGGRVGGWMWNRWGSSPAPSTTPIKATPTRDAIGAGSLAPSSASITSATSTSSTSGQTGISIPGSASSANAAGRSVVASPKKFMLRSPGVNQSGPIFGFGPERKLDPMPVVTSLNVNALRDVLEDS